jgi:RNA polymerase primary sigma factor|tara:strand:+ start:1017 stop:1901 length:885 start_codon:yes stop_codon:yes gene_type:complete
MNEELKSTPSQSLDIYFKQLSEHRLLSREEEVELGSKIQAWKSNSKAGQATRQNGKKALKKLVECNLRLVVKIAKDYRNIGLDFADLVGEGNEGLVKAAERFDPIYGAKFSTYCSYWVKQAIRRGLSNKSRTVRLPVGLIEQKNKVRHFIEGFKILHSRDPSPTEICSKLKLSYNKLCILLDADKSTISLDSPPPHSDESESRSLGDTLEDHLTQPPDCIAQIKSDNNILNLCLRKLNHRERTIIEYRFGLRNKEFETLESIGVRFKVTRERIRQIEESALKKLRFWIKKYKIK